MRVFIVGVTIIGPITAQRKTELLQTAQTETKLNSSLRVDIKLDRILFAENVISLVTQQSRASVNWAKNLGGQITGGKLSKIKD